MGKLKKSLKVARDLDKLEFKVYSADDSKPYKLYHPDDNYSVWVANGFWFIALYEVAGKNIDTNHEISKFGAIGKIVVWWKCRKHISKWYNDKKAANNKILENVLK